MHIEILATDGKVQKRLVWVSFTTNGVYCGACLQNRDLHMSYHADGNFFSNYEGKAKKIGTLNKLADFKGSRQLFSAALANDIARMPHPTYNLKKLDAIVNVDIRRYDKGLGCMVFLIEVNNYSVLTEMLNRFHERSLMLTEVHLFMDCCPWLVVVLYYTNKTPIG